MDVNIFSINLKFLKSLGFTIGASTYFFMINILDKTNSIANHFLFEMRDKDIQLDRGKFRNNLKRLGMTMAYEISKSLHFESKEIKTPLGNADVNLLSESPVIIGILRAALPFYEGFQSFYDQSEAGFVGAYRQENDEIAINFDYMATPSLKDRTVILVDPMLATGKSLIKTIENIEKNGKPKHIHIASVVAAPEGIDYISQSLKSNHTIWVYSLDSNLDDNAYIVPGLGDAGDLSFGEKK